MSEFEARGYAGDGEVIGDHLDIFERFRLGSATLAELRRWGVVSYQNEAHKNLRPCELFFVHAGVPIKRSNVLLTRVVERASAGGYGASERRTRAVEHCNSIYHAIGAGFVTQMYLKADGGGGSALLRDYLKELELKIKITGDIIRNYRILLMITMTSIFALNVVLISNTLFPVSSDDLGSVTNQIILTPPILGVAFLSLSILICIKVLLVLGTEPILNNEILNHNTDELVNMNERDYFEPRIRVYSDHVRSNMTTMKSLRNWFVVSIAYIAVGLVLYVIGMIFRAVVL